MVVADTLRARVPHSMLSEEPRTPTLEQGTHNTTTEAFCALVEQYLDYAYNIAFRILQNAADAEDAVQEAFISAYRAYPSFKGHSKVSTWLYRIVVNACLLRIRKQRIRARYFIEAGYDDPIAHHWSGNPERAALNSELHDVLEAGLGLLGPELRAAIVLTGVEGLSNEEAANALDISLPAFKSRLHRARVHLRKYLEGYLAKPDGKMMASKHKSNSGRN